MAALIDFVDYRGFQVLFTVILCLSLFIFTRYYIVLACLVIGYKILRPVLESFFVTPLDLAGRGVFITGCDLGFGHKLAEYLDGLGFVVFASCLNEESVGAKRLREIGSKRLSVLEVDVTNGRSVEKAGQYVKKHLPKRGLWAVINNAGVNACCDLELTSKETYEKCLDVNLYGAIRVCKQLLPFIRHSKGRVVNITSVHGFLSLPKWDIYEVSKHGLETLSDSLRLEMKKFDVGVSLVEPGAFTTAVSSQQNAERIKDDIRYNWEKTTEEVRQGYGSLDDVLSFVFEPRTFPWPPGDNLMPIVKAVEHAIRSKYPYSRYMVAGEARQLRFIDEFPIVAKLYKLLPTWIMDEYIVYWRNARKFRM